MAEMREQSAAKLQRLDAALNKAYQAEIEKHAGDEAYQADLKEAQRAWLRYVDFHLKTVFPLKKGENPTEVYGSVYPVDYAEAKSSMLAVRIRELGGKETSDMKSPESTLKK